MKLTLRQLVNASPALGRLVEQKFTCKGSGKIIYALSKNLALTEKELLAYQKAMNSLIEKYRIQEVQTEEEIKEHKEPKYYFPPSVQKELEIETGELLDDEMELDIRPVILPEPTDDTPSLINAVDLYLLNWMVSFEGYD
jgi:hypothetical protein